MNWFPAHLTRRAAVHLAANFILQSHSRWILSLKSFSLWVLSDLVGDDKAELFKRASSRPPAPQIDGKLPRQSDRHLFAHDSASLDFHQQLFVGVPLRLVPEK